MSKRSGMIIDTKFDDLFKYYPILNEVFGELFIKHGVINKEPVLRFICNVYDPLSPFTRQYPDIKQRKEKVAKDLGLKVKEIPNEIIVHYLIHVLRNRDWTYIMTLEENYSEYIEVLNMPVDIDDKNELIKTVDLKGKLRAQANEMRQQIPELYKTFFGGDEDLEQEHFTYTPENIAKNLKK